MSKKATHVNSQRIHKLRTCTHTFGLGIRVYVKAKLCSKQYPAGANKTHQHDPNPTLSSRPGIKRETGMISFFNTWFFVLGIHLNDEVTHCFFWREYI